MKLVLLYNESIRYSNSKIYKLTTSGVSVIIRNKYIQNEYKHNSLNILINTSHYNYS